MFAQSPEPEAHDKVLTIIQIELEFGNVFFFGGGGRGEGGRGENRSSRRKTSRSKEENHQKQTQPIYAATSGNQTQDTLVGGEP